MTASGGPGRGRSAQAGCAAGQCGPVGQRRPRGYFVVGLRPDDLGVDEVRVALARHGNAIVAVLDEVSAANLEDRNGRHDAVGERPAQASEAAARQATAGFESRSKSFSGSPTPRYGRSESPSRPRSSGRPRAADGEFVERVGHPNDQSARTAGTPPWPRRNRHTRSRPRPTRGLGVRPSEALRRSSLAPPVQGDRRQASGAPCRSRQPLARAMKGQNRCHGSSWSAARPHS